MIPLKFRLIVIYGFFWVFLGILTIMMGYMILVFYEDHELLTGIIFQRFLYITGTIEIIIGMLSINFHKMKTLYRLVLIFFVIAIPISTFIFNKFEIFYASKFFICFLSIFSILTLISIVRSQVSQHGNPRIKGRG